MQYTIDHFAKKLKTARSYRKMKTQAMACKAIDVSRQVWSLWELGHRKPGLPQLIEIANLFKLDVCFFFTHPAEPEDFDLEKYPLSAGKRKVRKK